MWFFLKKASDYKLNSSNAPILWLEVKYFVFPLIFTCRQKLCKQYYLFILLILVSLFICTMMRGAFYVKSLWIIVGRKKNSQNKWLKRNPDSYRVIACSVFCELWANITKAANMITKFFTTYCPSRLNEPNLSPNMSSGEKKNVLKVKVRWVIRMYKVGRRKNLAIRFKPIIISIIPSTLKPINPSTRPNESCSTVATAISHAGLQPGISFKTPNHKKHSPMHIRSAARLLRW